MVEELLLFFLEAVGALVLQEAVETGDYAAGYVVGPYACSGAIVGVFGEEVWCVVWEGFLEELAEYCAFVERLVLILECGYEAAWVQVEERLGLVVGVDFDVLVLNAFFFEGDPGALDEWAEPA